VSASDAIVSVRDLSVNYGEENVSIDMPAGRISVVLGGSGCGKTTLIKTIVGLIRPSSGFVTILHERTDELDDQGWARLRRRTGMLFQNGALLNSMTVLQNVSIPLEQHTALASELSGGMRKRAALARALALDPELLFFDEPSAGLDPVTAAALDALIVGLRDRLKMSLVVVTHELASIRRLADRIVFLDQGRVLFEGSPAEIAGAPEPVRYFFEAGRTPI
jgi:phospholipid/cholesterol/gamma-HCH transport system ATP-binding protein